MLNLKSTVSAIAIVAPFALALIVSAPAQATGLFDFLDTCIKARSDFSERREDYFTKLAEAEKSVDTLEPTAQFKADWMKAVRASARKLFDEKIAAGLQKMGVTDLENAFTVWLDMEIAALKAGELDQQITKDYRTVAKMELADIRRQATTQTDKGKSELDDGCKSDVGSQMLRVALAPVGWIAGNFEAAKNEKNVVTQVFHALTGAGIQSIAENGLLGGSGSDARKVLEPVIGGRNGAIQKGAGDTWKALTKWRF